jgi:hypothetical protein
MYHYAEQPAEHRSDLIDRATALLNIRALHLHEISSIADIYLEHVPALRG